MRQACPVGRRCPASSVHEAHCVKLSAAEHSTGERQRNEKLGASPFVRRMENAAPPYPAPRNWGPRKSPAKRVLWGEDEQGSERNFRCQAEMELSGLCEDERVRGCRRYGRKRVLGA